MDVPISIIWTSSFPFLGFFLGFSGDTVVWCLDSGLGLGLSCTGDFRSLVSVVAGEDCGSDVFSAKFFGVVYRCGGVGCGVEVLHQTAFLVVGPVAVGNFAFLFGCAPVGRASDSAVVPTWGLVYWWVLFAVGPLSLPCLLVVS